MKINLLLCSYLFVCFGYAGENGSDAANPESDVKINKIFASYQQALTSRDTAFANQQFISDDEFQQILAYVKKNQPNCIGADESAFKAEGNKATYYDLLSSKLVIDEIRIKSIEHTYSCGNLLEIPRVVCEVRVNKHIIEVPFLLIWTLNNQYKILRNFLSYKMLADD